MWALSRLSEQQRLRQRQAADLLSVNDFPFAELPVIGQQIRAWHPLLIILYIKSRTGLFYYYCCYFFSSWKAISLQEVRRIHWKWSRREWWFLDLSLFVLLMETKRLHLDLPSKQPLSFLFVILLLLFFFSFKYMFSDFEKETTKQTDTHCDRFPSFLVHGKERNVIQSQGQRGPRGLSRLHAALVLIRRAMRRNNWPLI